MHRNKLWLIFAVLCIYFSLVFCAESMAVQELESKESSDLLRSDRTGTALKEEARTRKRHHHHLYSFWGVYGLAVAYLIKVKLVVVAFFVGSAVFMGLRYLWPHKCAGGEIYKEGSIVLDHPPSFAHHDHVPYSLDNDHYHDHHPYGSGSFTSSGPTSFEPYSAYSSQSYTEPEGPYSSLPFTAAGSAPEALTSDSRGLRRKRSEPTDDQHKAEVIETLENLARQMVVKEEQIGEFMLNFLGLDTAACRRRFICEMEFKSRTNSLTSMAFRVIGRSIFAKYTNNENPFRKANSFEECRAVNEECVFIENNEETAYETQQTDNMTEVQEQVETSDNKSEENESNLKAELANSALRKRFKAQRHLKFI